MKPLKQVKYFFEWLWDWYVLPVIEAVRPQPKDSAPKDYGQTLDDE